MPDRTVSISPRTPKINMSHLVFRKRVELIDGAEHVDELDNSSAEQVEFPCWLCAKLVSGLSGLSKRHGNVLSRRWKNSPRSPSHPLLHFPLLCLAYSTGGAKFTSLILPYMPPSLSPPRASSSSLSRPIGKLLEISGQNRTSHPCPSFSLDCVLSVLPSRHTAMHVCHRVVASHQRSRSR